MPRRSHRQHQGGHSAEFWDDDDLYEGHTADRERNRDVYEFKDGDSNRNRKEWLDKGSVMVDYLKHYNFVAETVKYLLILYSKDLCTHTSLKAIALRTIVNTQIKNINRIMYGLPNLEKAQKEISPGHERMVAMERDIHQNHRDYIKKMSKIAALVQKLHPHLDLWYTQDGLDSSYGDIWCAFDTSCSKIPENFPEETGKAKRVSKLSNLLTQLQDLDTMI